MARYQHPSPLDLMFFAADHALKRLGLPGHNIHIYLDLRGALDLPRFRDALRSLYRVYPTLAAKRVRSLLTGLPRWRLDVRTLDMNEVVRLHEVKPRTADQAQRQAEDLLTCPLDDTNLPPVQFHVFRGAPPGDIVVVRWPHGLMDARGGLFVLEDLDRVFNERPSTDTLRAAGDERAAPFAAIVKDVPIVRRARLALQSLRESSPPDQRTAILAQPRDLHQIGRMRCVLRHLSPAQSQVIRDNALRICGFARFGDYLRACAIRAFRDVMPETTPPATHISTLNLIDLRRRRQRGPVCWNLTGALPLSAPVDAADECLRVADLVRDQTAAHLASKTVVQTFAAQSILMRIPTRFAGAALHASWRGSGRRRHALGNVPSLPLGLMAPFSRPMPTFCGAELLNYYGFRTVLPQPGFSLDVSANEDRINISGACLDGCVSPTLLSELIEKVVTRLTDPW